MAPRFLGSKSKNWRKQPAQRVENLTHDCLRCAPTRRIRRVAIQPVLGDVDIKAAQIDGAKLVKYVINLVELERIISRPAIASHLVKPPQNPAIDERCSRHR